MALSAGIIVEDRILQNGIVPDPIVVTSPPPRQIRGDSGVRDVDGTVRDNSSSIAPCCVATDRHVGQCCAICKVIIDAATIIAGHVGVYGHPI